MTTRLPGKPAKPAPRVFLVVDEGSDLALAIFAHVEDAELFAHAIGDIWKNTVKIESRRLWYGQPSNPGYNE